MIRWYDDIRLDQHSIHMCPRIPYRMSHRCILIQQKYIVLYREFLFTCMLCFPYAWVYKVSIRNNKTKTNQLLKCITYGFFFHIEQSLDSVYLNIVFTYKQTHFEIAQAILLFLFRLCKHVMTCNSLLNFLPYTFLIFNFIDYLSIVWNDIIEG